MKKIGGNTTLELQIKRVTDNEIGEQESTWETIHTLTGFLDLSSGDSRYTNYNAKIQESTHFFICDYQMLDQTAKVENSRFFEPKTSNYYDITLIDNPMNLNYHLEFYLRYVGGQYE